MKPGEEDEKDRRTGPGTEWQGVDSYSIRCNMSEYSIASASALELDIIAFVL